MVLAEIIMARFGWSAVWITGVLDPDDLPAGVTDYRPLEVFRGRGVYVGVWTGPDHDMICVRCCETNADADRYRSPPGRTVLDATLRSLAVRLSNGLATHLQEVEVRKWLRRQAEIGDTDEEDDRDIERSRVVAE